MEIPSTTTIVSVILALTVLSVIWVGHKNRLGDANNPRKGMGWQFIRYTVLTIAIPVTAILALNNALTGEAATIIGGAMGYAFGNAGKTSVKDA